MPRLRPSSLRRAALALAATSTLGLPAQNAALGNISGVVRDSSGAIVPNATVTVTNTGTGASRTLTTDSDGHYLASFLQPGSYEVVLTGTGYGRIDQKNVAVTVGSTNTVDATLPNASVSTDVVVTTDQVLVDADKVQASQTIGQQIVNNLPVNGRRWDNFVLLTPNVAPDGNSGLISYRGISGIYNTNLVDGANNQQAFFSEARGRSVGAPYVFPLDAIQEFESSVSSYSAELGQSAGGIVNAITKSGTNQLHGDVFYYYRTPGFNALDPLNKFQGRVGNNPLLLQQPVKVQHQFGASVGGPIIKDKLFFHMTYDGFRRVNPITYLSTYNTATTSIGQLAALCDGRTSNFLTRTSQTSTGTKTLIYPSVIPGITPGQCTSAVDFVSATQLGAFARNTTQDIYFPRLDWQATEKTHLSASFLFENLKIPNGYNSSTTVSNGGVSQNGGINFHQRFLTVNAETALTNRTSNVVHFQWSRDLETSGTNSGGPAINLTNLFSYGETAALPRPAFPDEHRWQITDIYSTTRGRHSLKLGVDVNLIHEQIENLFQGDGTFNYNTGTPEFNFANWIQDVYQVNGGRHYNSFSQVTDPITGVGADDFWNKNLDVFVEDNWKVTPSLLLSLGARYDVQLVPQPDRPNTSSSVAQLYTSTINTDYHMAAPRFGFAWNPQPGTVVRGGYGLFFGLSSNSTFYTIRRENGVYQQQFNVTPLPGAANLPNSPYVAIGGGSNLAFQQSGVYPTYAPQGGIPVFTPPGPAPINLVTGVATPAVNPGLPTSVLSARGLDPSFRNPFSHSFDLTVEQQLPLRSTLTMAYVGNRGMRLPIFVDTNVDPNSGSTARPYTAIAANGTTQQVALPIYSARLSDATGSVLTGFSDVNSWYHSLAVTIRKPLDHGVEVLANYTWAKTMDGGQISGVNGTFNGTNTPLIPFALGHRQGRGAEYSRSDLDQRGRFVGTLLATSKLPIGNRFAAYAANGWQLSGTFTAQTGFPLTALMANAPTSAILGDGGLTGAEVSLNNSGTPGRVPDQVARRNSFVGPGLHNLDARVSRTFPVREGMSFELAIEAFNVVNHRNILAVSTTAFSYQTPVQCGTNADTSAGCIVPYTQTPFATPTSTSSILYGPRQLQLLGKFYF